MNFSSHEVGNSMKKWMSVATGSLALIGINLAHASITEDPAQVADQVFRAGVEFCNSAAKSSRTDSKQARSDFDQYLSHFERARTIFPSLLQDNAYAERENHRCNQIGDDISRAEALPVIEKGLAMCQDARSALNRGNLEDSRSRFNQYELNRDRALKMSDSVLKVGSIAVQVRICNGLTDKIASAEKQNNNFARMARDVIAGLSRANDTCGLGTRLITSGDMNADKRAMLTDTLNQSQSQADEVATTATQLNRMGTPVVGKALDQIHALDTQLEQCAQTITAAVQQYDDAQKVAAVQVTAPIDAPAEVAPGFQPSQNPVTTSTVPVNALVHSGDADL